MAGYNDFWNPEYWTPEGYKKRKAEEANAHKKLAIQQNQSNVDTWGNIGKGIGEVGNFLGSIAPNRAVPEFLAKSLPGMIPKSTLAPKRTAGDDQDISGFESGSPLGAGMFGTEPPESETDRILKRLGEKFSFDDSQVDASALDSILNSNKTVLDDLRNRTRENYNTSDSNIASMHDAFRNDQLAQAPRIQQEGDTARSTVEGIFNKTIADNDARAARNKEVDAEMLQRLGIAPAANQPDIVGQEIQNGTNIAQSSRDARTSEIASNTQTNLARNSGWASAIGNEGVARRSELTNRLNEILGNIDEKEADFTNDYQRSKLELRNQEEDQAYQRWIQDRQFDMGLFDSINQNNQAMAKAQGSQQATGARGLMGTMSPAARQAIVAISQKVDISKDPQRGLREMVKMGVPESEAWTAITDYNKLGTTNKFAVEEY